MRYDADYGALLVDASASSMTFQFITRTGQVIDSFTINTGTPAAGASPGGHDPLTPSRRHCLRWVVRYGVRGDHGPSSSESPAGPCLPLRALEV